MRILLVLALPVVVAGMWIGVLAALVLERLGEARIGLLRAARSVREMFSNARRKD